MWKRWLANTAAAMYRKSPGNVFGSCGWSASYIFIEESDFILLRFLYIDFHFYQKTINTALISINSDEISIFLIFSIFFREVPMAFSKGLSVFYVVKKNRPSQKSNMIREIVRENRGEYEKVFDFMIRHLSKKICIEKNLVSVQEFFFFYIIYEFWLNCCNCAWIICRMNFMFYCYLINCLKNFYIFIILLLLPRLLPNYLGLASLYIYHYFSFVLCSHRYK